MLEDRRLHSFNFQIDWAGAQFGFSEISGIAQRMALDARRNNNNSESDSTSAADQKIAGLNQSLTITLKRGVFHGNSDFGSWLDDVKNKDGADRTNLTVRQFDEQGHVVAAWTVVRGYPTKVASHLLNATGNDVAIETLEIVHEGLRLIRTAREAKSDESMEPDFTDQLHIAPLKASRKWPDLKLKSAAVRQLRALEQWIVHNDPQTRSKEGRGSVASGYRALFYGASASDKTQAAALLGSHAKRDVFRVDLSQIISRYIGETEKNLSRLFDSAEQENWILFFDEADALFGKRSDVHDSHDRYANQEVSYLLQRIERYHGLAIFATNQTPDADDEFLRRMQTVVHFPRPDSE